VSHLLEPFYQPRSQQEIEQQPLAPYEWSKTKAALREATGLLHSRRDELAILDTRINLMARKNNEGNVTRFLSKQTVVATIISGLEQMLAEIEIRMEILNLEVERNLQALPHLYEDLAAQSQSLFSYLCSGEEIGIATQQLQTSYEEVTAISHHLHNLGYRFDEAAYCTCYRRIRRMLRSPASSQLQITTQIQDWLTQQAQESGEGEAFQMNEEAGQGISTDSLLGDYSH
jgi:hypothetical protein